MQSEFQFRGVMFKNKYIGEEEVAMCVLVWVSSYELHRVHLTLA